MHVPASLPPPALGAKQVMVVLLSPHIVDEVAMAAYQIISVPQGAVVRLVSGSLDKGLEAPYQDYILVEYNGKVGKISRLVVKEA
jgi:hypothetical protein